MLEKDLLKKILNQTKDYSNDPVLILSGKNWHEGVIGIVAARLKDKFNKPVIINFFRWRYWKSFSKINCWF